MGRRTAVLGIGILLTCAVIAAAACTDTNDGSGGDRAAASATEPTDPTSEGVQVHGHWALTVSDPDGTVVEHRTFENFLTSEGKAFLGKVLSRTKTTGLWRVLLFNNQEALCGQGQCTTVEKASDAADKPDTFKTLVVTPKPTGFTLEGTVVPDHNGSINIVATYVGTCAPSKTPAACIATTQSANFTSKVLESPVPIEAGQQVLVQVEITFS